MAQPYIFPGTWENIWPDSAPERVFLSGSHDKTIIDKQKGAAQVSDGRSPLKIDVYNKNQKAG
jgi:hypothetical protein